MVELNLSAEMKQKKGYAPSRGLRKGLLTQMLSDLEPLTDTICFLLHV